VKVEIRAGYLKSMREKRGLTQRQLAKDIGISQNYVPALEAGARRPGRNVQERLLNYFGCAFEELFEIVLVDPETSDERVLEPTAQRPGAPKR